MKLFCIILAMVAASAAHAAGNVDATGNHASDSDVSQPFKSMVMRRQQLNATTWPYGPLHTRGRDIVNSRGEIITLAGVNWPLSGKNGNNPASAVC